MAVPDRLPENVDDPTMATGWCHDKQACITMARLNNIQLEYADTQAYHREHWPKNQCRCCGCGKFINFKVNK
jgi:hypothetical protein